MTDQAFDLWMCTVYICEGVRHLGGGTAEIPIFFKKKLLMIKKFKKNL